MPDEVVHALGVLVRLIEIAGAGILVFGFVVETGLDRSGDSRRCHHHQDDHARTNRRELELPGDHGDHSHGAGMDDGARDKRPVAVAEAWVRRDGIASKLV